MLGALAAISGCCFCSPPIFLLAPTFAPAAPQFAFLVYLLSFFLFLWILSFFCHSQAFLPALAALLLAFLKLPESLIGLLDQNDQELAVGGRNPISTIFPTTCANWQHPFQENLIEAFFLQQLTASTREPITIHKWPTISMYPCFKPHFKPTLLAPYYDLQNSAIESNVPLIYAICSLIIPQKLNLATSITPATDKCHYHIIQCTHTFKCNRTNLCLRLILKSIFCQVVTFIFQQCKHLKRFVNWKDVTEK